MEIDSWVSPTSRTETVNKDQMKSWEYWYLKLFRSPTVDDLEYGLEFYRWKNKIYVIERGIMETRITIEVDKEEFDRLRHLMKDSDNILLSDADYSEMGFIEVKGIDGRVVVGISCEEG